jgi:hypothetical protein
MAKGSGLFGDPVVGDHIGALLRRGEMVKPDNRHLGEALKPRASMAARL